MKTRNSCLVFLYERFLLLLFGKDETTVSKIWQFLRFFSVIQQFMKPYFVIHEFLS